MFYVIIKVCFMSFKARVWNQITFHLWLVRTTEWVRTMFLFLMKQKGRENRVHCTAQRSRILFCEHTYTGTHICTHMNTHAHTPTVSTCVLSCNAVFTSHSGSWAKKPKSHQCNTRPIPMAMFQKRRQKNNALLLKLEHTLKLTRLFSSYLEDTASQSWPSPLGRWPVRPTTEGRGLLLPGEGFWE